MNSPGFAEHRTKCSGKSQRHKPNTNLHNIELLPILVLLLWKATNRDICKDFDVWKTEIVNTLLTLHKLAYDCKETNLESMVSNITLIIHKNAPNIMMLFTFGEDILIYL